MTFITKSMTAVFASAVLSLSALPAQASQVASEWYMASWNCNIDGRPARMTWRVVDNSQTSCSGDFCSQTSGVAIRGRFSDNGGPWVSLTRLSSGPNFLRLRHADGNVWRLNVTGPRNASGWTTWNGQRYPLSCWR